MASTAPVPQALEPCGQVLPPLPIRPGPVDVGPWKPMSTTPVVALRAASFDRCQTQRLLESSVESRCAGVPQVLSLSGRCSRALAGITMESKSPPM